MLYIWIAKYMGISEEISEALIPLHSAPIFWLTIFLLVGTVFVAEVGMEFYRMSYHMNGSDWVRAFMKQKNGHGWNDLNEDIEITTEDLKRIDDFMKPINARHRKQDLAREKYLDEIRESQISELKLQRMNSSV